MRNQNFVTREAVVRNLLSVFFAEFYQKGFVKIELPYGFILNDKFKKRVHKFMWEYLFIKENQTDIEELLDNTSKSIYEVLTGSKMNKERFFYIERLENSNFFYNGYLSVDSIFFRLNFALKKVVFSELDNLKCGFYMEETVVKMKKNLYKRSYREADFEQFALEVVYFCECLKKLFYKVAEIELKDD